jgi:alpha-L-fucosidase 2
MVHRKSPLIRPYQTFCDLEIDFEHSGEITDYRRELDFDEGTVRVGYSVDGTRHTCEVFVSAPDDALVVRIESEGTVSASITLSGSE